MLMQRQKSSMLLKPPPLTMQTDQPKDKHEGGVRKKKIKWNIYWETCSSGQLLWFHLESKDSSLHPKYHRNASAEIPLGFNGRSCVKWQLHSVRTLSWQERAMLECTNAKGREKKVTHTLIQALLMLVSCTLKTSQVELPLHFLNWCFFGWQKGERGVRWEISCQNINGSSEF